MPSLRDLRDRIKSVKSTKKITSAMKMVAASKLRKAQAQAEAAHPYATALGQIMDRVAKNTNPNIPGLELLNGTGSDHRHLLIVVTSDRGLCGGFNANLIKEARRKIYFLLKEEKEVQVICVGRKAKESLERDLKKYIIKSFTGIGEGNRVDFSEANMLRNFVLERFEEGAFDLCSLLYNDFRSVLIQKPKLQQIIPFAAQERANKQEDQEKDNAKDSSVIRPYDYEPDEQEILSRLLPKNIGMQIYRALLDSAAGEQAARMTAMDNATRNAGDMIDDLTLEYNRARQAYITKELIEIISGAEAL